jgi:hypothetical protein
VAATLARQGDAELAYVLKYQAEDAIKRDEPYHYTALTGLTDEQLFEEIHNIQKLRSYRLLSFDHCLEEMEQLLEANNHLQFSKKLKQFSLNKSEKALLILACDMLVNKGDEIISNDDYENLFDTRSMFIRLHKSLSNETSALIKQGLLKRADDEHLVVDDFFMLTNKVRTEMLSNVGITELKLEATKQKDLTYPSTIVSKELYYNPSEAHQITRLESLLQPDAFNNICSRLAEQGMRKGFACLFYGAPGTGKTETVLQLARKCGRDIMQVNISTIKSKWVGESEKNIKAIFDRYRTAVQQSEIAPILLFNEADAIISKRMSNAQRSVDKMDNAIQNIILEEMEKLEVILIATTNLAGNMDSAFERRFIYKIEFKNPSVEAKMSIWKSMIPALNDEMAYILAQKYDFSGGQIENIARKHTVEYVLTGKNADIDNLTQICDSEQLNKRSNRPIGY